MSEFLPYITAFGVGSLVSVIIQGWLTTRSTNLQKIYDERKEAYLGLLESWKRQDQEGTNDHNSFDVGHWVLRAEIVASDIVFDNLNHWKNTEPGSPERISATKKLKHAMRNDLRSL